MLGGCLQWSWKVLFLPFLMQKRDDASSWVFVVDRRSSKGLNSSSCRRWCCWPSDRGNSSSANGACCYHPCVRVFRLQKCPSPVPSSLAPTWPSVGCAWLTRCCTCCWGWSGSGWGGGQCRQASVLVVLLAFPLLWTPEE